MQPLVHPGPISERRIISVPVRTQRVFYPLQPGRTIVGQLHEALVALGADSGFAELHGGEYAPLSYCTPDVATRERALSFSDTSDHNRAPLLYGSVTLGVRENEPYMHSHCFWQALDGTLEGGHVWLETEAGSTPPFAVVTAVFGALWRSTTDPETNMPVFTPEKLGAVMQHETDTIIARVLPNIDITEALLKVCREAGYERASVRAGLGSFVGATFIDRVSGEHITVDGPATEVIALIGDVHTVDGELQTQLSCTLVDRHGVIHAGQLVPGENLIAATFELTVQRLDASDAVVS